jgi:predicted LPLAT superfamily acyltransferase
LTAPGAAPGRDWASQRERGSKALLRLMVWITLTLGWRAGTALLFPITGYFFVASPAARAASRDYLARVLDRPASGRDVLRHMFTFACVILDRVFLLSGRLRGFAIDVRGLEALTAILGRGQGCVLLGAHVGSFDVLRAVGRDAPVAVRPLMYREHWGAMTPLLEALDPELASAIIEIGRPDTMLRVQESVARGEIVGILADRAPAERRLVAARLLGATAHFPAGPFVVAGLLGAPVVVFHGVRTGPRRYQVRFEPFADRLVLKRATRQQDLENAVAKYAASLETVCRAHPFNWFNFYPFWEKPDHAE